LQGAISLALENRQQIATVNFEQRLFVDGAAALEPPAGEPLLNRRGLCECRYSGDETRRRGPSRSASRRPQEAAGEAPGQADGAAIFQQACRMGLEGIVSKRLSAPYRSGPSRDWFKIKNPDSPAMIRAREAEW